MKTKRVAIYCRVDGGGASETQQQTLDFQKQALGRYARSLGLQIVGYYQDAGHSGHDMDRPGLKQLMRDCSDGAFEQVLVVDHSRLYCGSRGEEPQWPFHICSMNQLEENLMC